MGVYSMCVVGHVRGVVLGMVVGVWEGGGGGRPGAWGVSQATVAVCARQ